MRTTKGNVEMHNQKRISLKPQKRISLSCTQTHTHAHTHRRALKTRTSAYPLVTLRSWFMCTFMSRPKPEGNTQDEDAKKKGMVVMMTMMTTMMMVVNRWAHTGTDIHTQAQIDTDRQTHTHTGTDRHRQTHTHTGIDAHTRTHTHSQAHQQQQKIGQVMW